MTTGNRRLASDAAIVDFYREQVEKEERLAGRR